jgi:hypothetical protein
LLEERAFGFGEGEFVECEELEAATAKANLL